MEPTIEVPYPFVRRTFSNVDEDGTGFSDESWGPGVNQLRVPELHGMWEVGESMAHGMGVMLLTVVSRVKLPGRYADRVFYVRRWRDPDGKEFGKTQLRVTTAAGFKRMLSGYRYSYRLEE